ncbi:MAG: trypsin-like peptidase domain-containing protein, partial [Candidatus Tritonobacter lacicola]|nr:trypsin-like peptidase domain-containing protein [Candidatus Tritonobacter lacicola]
MKKHWLPIIPLFFVLLPAAHCSAADGEELGRIRSALVSIKSVIQRPDYNSPWKNYDYRAGSGSGFIIKGQRIITNAHLVSDSKYIEVKKENSATPYRAIVSFIGHDCDLAILDVPDKSFFDG